MYTFLFIVGPIVTLIAILIAVNENNDLYNRTDSTAIKIGRVVVYSAIGIVLGLLITMMILVIGSGKGEYDKVVTHELISISDGSQMSGSFTLGSGHIGEKLTYSYYRKVEDGGMVRRNISSDLTTIYEIDSLETPHIEVHIVTGEEQSKNHWLPLVNNDGNQKYKLYLPKGSIIKEINLDNQ